MRGGLRYQQVRDFSASFVHNYRGGVLRTQSSERGTVSVKKPGKMRWIYTNPERKEIVSDGAKIYTHIVADKQVIVSPAFPILMLWGLYTTIFVLLTQRYEKLRKVGQYEAA